MARVVVATAYGGPEVLHLIDVDPGPPGPGQVLLEVRAAGVNPADWKRYSGAWGTDPAKLPMRLGFEASGVVRAVGPGVADVSVGDEVIAYPVDGAYAEQVLVPATSLVPKPPLLSWEKAAGLLLAGATAAHALKATAVGAGDTVLVHGASGGVGAMAVRLAHLKGARVIGTASPANHEYVLDLGATPIAYGPGLERRVREAAPAGVHAVVDTAGTDEALETSIAVVSDLRRVATLAGFARGTQLGIQVLGGVTAKEIAIRAQARHRLVELAAAGRLDVRIAAKYHLSDAAKAHRLGMGGRTPGKIILVPDSVAARGHEHGSAGKAVAADSEPKTDGRGRPGRRRRITRH
ncbi:NADP-dependent oxidoreductase [Cellulomonas sp. KRMCY2]|uniref:NADP-dependent oxidoreductase n=1 Tax=Cellulomonas sp. KRMCY2 TaxID=1304865 RepID=UPI00045E650E|nr:NADP-dependent oxidoreductase [Cellulomonas sp. KRMCY2]